MTETPEQRTARITREIEEERKIRHQQMDQSFSSQKKILSSEQKEMWKEAKQHKREQNKIKWGKRKESIKSFFTQISHFLYKALCRILASLYLLFKALLIILLICTIIYLLFYLFSRFAIVIIAFSIFMIALRFRS